MSKMKDDCCGESNTHPIKSAWDYNQIRQADRTTQWNTELDRKTGRANMDKFLGCLIGGAAGDALGYTVEFLSEAAIRAEFGNKGITEYRYENGLARISDDTQMILFTANGLLHGETRFHTEDIMGYPRGYVAAAYRECYKTQQVSKPDAGEKDCWLMNVPRLYARRAPGNTCLSAIAAGCSGSIERPVNDSDSTRKQERKCLWK